MRTSDQIKAEIAEKFGFFPPFFSPAEQNPQVLDNLWQQTLSAYVNNPLPPLFKEKLAAYLSRYCAIPYCMICHSCSLRPLGVRAREVLELLEAPPPAETDVNAHFRVLATHAEQLTVLSNWNSAVEESLLACAVFISLEGEPADYYRTQLRHLLGTVNYQHLVSFIAYVKTCHAWMEAHPEVAYTADKRAIDHFSFLLGDEPGLSNFLHHYWERVKRERQSWAEQQAAIAERKQHEMALRQSEERLKLALEAAHMGTWGWDILTKKVSHSITTEAHFGLTPGSFDGTYESFLANVHPDDRQFVYQAITQAVQAGADYEIEFRVIWIDNSIHWVASKGQVYYDNTGKAVHMAGVTMDISDRKRAEEALRQSEEKFRNLVEQTSDWVWEIDHNGVFTYVSPKVSEILGYEFADILGKSTFDFMAENEVKRFAQVVSYFISTQQPFTRLEKTLTHKDGHSVVLETSGSPVFDRQGVFQGYHGIARDITERREIERLKDEFVSVVSHELRTPLTSIRGALGLLASGVLRAQPEKGQRMLEIAVNNTDRLVRLINDILDIERIESGKVTMTRQACNVADLLTQSADVMQDMAEKAGVTLWVSPVSARLWVDPDRIIQVLTNLLSNAIKFSPHGSTVWLTAELVRIEQMEQNWALQLLFQVKDEGRGIPVDKLETIFGRFQQVDASDSRRKGGTGLGLAICRSIIQHHGGRIWAESTLGEGSTFCFTLPVLPSESAVAIADSSNPLVLVCDDDASVRDVMQAMLEKQGYRALTVASGQAAVEQAAAQQPDVILLNLMMPGMYGWETLAILKQQPNTQKIPVIILSGLLPDARESPHPGVSDWIVKPPDQQLLFQALEQALNETNRNVRVLVVEDDLDLALVLIAMFERHGIETYHAQTGREAIQMSQRVIPDLLVLDLVLPECNGFTVVDWLRQHNRLCQVALVVYTAKDLHDSDRERLKLGQTLFLTKGRITPEEFEQRVIKLLNRII